MKRRNVFLLLAGFILFSAISPQIVQASTKTSGTSALLADAAVNPPKVVVDNRAKILKAYLEMYNSPLADNAQTFIDEADKNNLDWRIVPAITGVESYFGQMIPAYSYNGWGFGVYGNNVRRFASWDEGIAVVTNSLRNEYMNARGAENIYQIGSTYAADPNWENKVTRFMNEIDAFATKTEKPSLSITI